MNRNIAIFLTVLAILMFGGLLISGIEENKLMIEMGKQGLCKDKNIWTKCK